jgi:hypothetical protein
MTNGGLAAIAILLAMTATPAAAAECQEGVVVYSCEDGYAQRQQQMRNDMRSLQYEMHGLEYEQQRQRDLDNMQPPRSEHDDVLRYDQYRRRY